MCTEISEYHFQSVHHEMGHIQYYLQYAKQPYTLREAPNPGFHEAIGDTIALSVSSTKHLQKIHLLNDYEDNYESTINTLMDMALQKIAMVPCCLIIDKWRWDVFSGAVTRDNWNSHWWEYRKKYQKLKPPVARSEADFDPGSQFHVAVGAPYME
jgi:peptidyl-dipeptidase A